VTWSQKNEKNSRKLALFHFLEIFAPLEANMMKNDKNMIKK
jgi:hypothetical protein